ncbi:hypothetical protein KIP88_08580 [Bradyrhizobium sp. SRL28]|uniref:hypothetical protein n=1 Tax=Bradyrhizobium sp. SRL28 TaxID=2836178 RepID=UPI001BDE9C11|nr:hypothetical protein [Bradyrhizobium sp. SRL28]MBT1510555.1 hypothetical protein [Bradyrhizobium sp. SRL28]
MRVLAVLLGVGICFRLYCSGPIISPSAVIPKKCAIKITRYETKEEDPERDNLAGQFTVEGPAYQLIHEAVGRVTEMMSSIEVWSTTGLKKLEYPPEALWKTIVNAVIHRDYSTSDDIQILVFDNRTEILGPASCPAMSLLRTSEGAFPNTKSVSRSPKQGSGRGRKETT